MFEWVTKQYAPVFGYLTLVWCCCMAFGCSAYDPSLLQLATTGSGLSHDAGSGNTDSGAIVDQGPDGPPIRCGDGLITGAEKCDTAIENGKPGACPVSCPPLAACAPRALNGTGCLAECTLLPLVCKSGDGCCPGNCTGANDADCSASCGDGIVQQTSGETCEAGSSQPCKASAAECGDGNPCTTDTLIGSAKNCNAACTHDPITAAKHDDGCCPSGANATTDMDCKPVCGNGIREAGEDCDKTAGCDAKCKANLQPEQASCMAKFGTDDCARCSCLNCTDTYTACRDTTDVTANRDCNEILVCARAKNCLGTPCYCGDGDLCGTPPGPCQTQIETAANSNLGLIITLLAADPTSTVGAALAADRCRVEQCRDVCRPSTP